MAIPSYIFGGNAAAKTPQEAARQRAIFEAMAARRESPKNVGEGLNSIGQALLARSMMDRASQGEEQGRASASRLFAGLQDGADQSELMAAMGDPWLAENAGQSAVVRAMLEQEFQQQDPAYQLGIEKLGLEMDALRNPVPKPPETRVIFDPETGREQIAQWDPASNDWSPVGGLKAPTGDGITINTGENSSPFNKKAAEAAATRFDTIVSQGNDAANFIGDLEALTEIGKNLDTGKGAEITAALGPYAEFLGFSIEGLDEAQAYDAIISRMAPQMRLPGSGASSDFDARQFLKSLPGLGKTPEGNAIIIETFQAIQERKVAAADIAMRALNDEISWQDADRAIADLGDPFTAFNDYRVAIGEDEPEGVSVTVPRIKDEAEFDALPSGATFIDPDGVTRRKP